MPFREAQIDTSLDVFAIYLGCLCCHERAEFHNQQARCLRANQREVRTCVEQKNCGLIVHRGIEQDHAVDGVEGKAESALTA